MDDPLDSLRSFVKTFVDRERDLQSLEGPVLHYGLFLRKILDSHRQRFLLQRDINEPTQTGSGAAVTPWHAAACMEDRLRTAAFIRGSVQAVRRALEQSSKRPLHLLEAGCGPLGTLVLPLLAHFSKKELVISLVDLHQESIDCVEAMLDHFGFLPRVGQLIHGDILNTRLDSPADIVLTETMNTALSQEPQVAIFRALVRQYPDAVLVPQAIRVDCVMLDAAKEASSFPPRVCDRIVLANVFELDRRTSLELKETDGYLPAGRVDIPDSIEPGLTPFLTTAIQVFEDVQVANYETQISYPVPLQTAGQATIQAGSSLQFAYRMGVSPGLVWRLITPNER